MRRRRICALVAMAALLGASGLLPSAALAADLEACRALQQQRDELAQQAMTAELQLVRQIREQVCPDLHRAAEAANALTPGYDSVKAAAIDLQALRDCRHTAERQLEARHRQRYRNRLGFGFYTAAGAARAAAADRVAARLNHQGCRRLAAEARAAASGRTKPEGAGSR